MTAQVLSFDVFFEKGPHLNAVEYHDEHQPLKLHNSFITLYHEII